MSIVQNPCEISSPVTIVQQIANIPLTLIVHSEDDNNFVAGSKLYHAALEKAKMPSTFLLYPTGGHGYALHCTRKARAWPQAAVEWLHQTGVLKKEESD